MANDDDGSFEAFNRNFAIFANQQAAEIEALRVILQVLLMEFNAQRVADIQDRAVAALRRNEAEAPDQDARRKAAIVVARAEAFFADILPILRGKTPTGNGGPGTPH